MPPGVVNLTILQLLAAELGPESPLPPLTGLQRLPDPSSSPDLPPKMRERIAYGRLPNPLPYALQNGYSRDLRPRRFLQFGWRTVGWKHSCFRAWGAGSGHCATWWPIAIWCS